MSGYDKKDAAKDTGSTTSSVSEAHHDARTDSGVRDSGSKRGSEETATKGEQAEAQATEAAFGLKDPRDK